MVEKNHQRVIPNLLFFVIVGAAACCLTLLDIALFTLYLTYWLPALVVVAVPVVLCLIEPARIRLILLGLLIAWIAILPNVRWHYNKSFFIDAHRLRTGMTLVQTRTIMEPYLEFDEFPNSIMFKPYEGGGDACIVQLKDDLVVRITIGVD